MPQTVPLLLPPQLLLALCQDGIARVLDIVSSRLLFQIGSHENVSRCKHCGLCCVWQKMGADYLVKTT